MVIYVSSFISNYLKGLSFEKIILSLIIAYMISGIIKKYVWSGNMNWATQIGIVLYFSALLIVTLLGRQKNTEVSLRYLLLSYQMLMWKVKSALWDILLNILLFIPYGYIIADKSSKLRRTQQIVIIVISSLAIETIQFLFSIGQFELCDLIDNSIGGLIGIHLVLLIQRICKNK